MTDHNQHPLWDLALAYEDLVESQRLRVDQVLAENPDWRRDWETIRNLEKKATLDWPLDHDAFWQPDMDPGTARQCQESLNRILAAMPEHIPTVDSRVATTRDSRRTRSWVRWVLPLAAVLAIAVFAPRMLVDKTLIGPISVQTLQLTGDGTRSGQTPKPVSGQLRTGQAFVLNMSPESDGWLVVYHVDPKGAYSRVFAGEPPHDPNGIVTIPTAASGEIWVLDGEPGTESFVVGATGDRPPELAALEAELARHCESAADRVVVVNAISATLDRILDEVQVLTVTHVD